MPTLYCPHCRSVLNLPESPEAQTTACPVCRAPGPLVPQQVGATNGTAGRLEAVRQETVTRPPVQPEAIPLPIPSWSTFWELPADEQQRLIRDLDAYRQALPQLLHEGQAGRYAVFSAGQLASIWDTQADALQAAAERFDLGTYAVQKIDPRDGDRLNQLAAQARATCQP